MSSKKIVVKALVVALFLVASSNVRAEMCSADCNCDGQVNLTDLVQMKQEYFRNDCDPVCLPEVVGGVPKTGQTLCYDTDGIQRDCAGTGEDGNFEKGVAWPNPRFTDNENGTITDNLTGLIWLKNANCFTTRNWEQALSECNALANGACGLSDGSQAGDWRLPNYKELLSLVDPANYSPALPAGHLFSNVQNGNYWSSTSYESDPHFAWLVFMNVGYSSSINKTGFIYVWPVRGGQ